jgi:aminoglycoside phosphotransferase (APT) family kinase protein
VQADTLAGLHRTKQPSPRSKTQKQDQEEHKMKFTGRYTAATAKALKGQDPSQAGFAKPNLSVRPNYTIGLNVSF